MKRVEPIGIFLTDTHKHKDNLELVYDIFMQALDLSDDVGVDDIFHAGDFFTDRVGQNLMNLLCFRRILTQFQKRGKTLHAIPGNHDKTNQESEESYLSIYKYSSFKLYKKESLIDFKGIKIGFLPYFSISMGERLSKLNKSLNDDSKSLLIVHGSFNGVRNNDGSEVTDGLTIKSVKKWGKVIVGHYHDSSFLKPNVYYTGSAYQSNFGENHNDKGFHVIYNDLSLEFHPSKFKKYIKVNLTPDDDIEEELSHYEKMDANIRFIFHGGKTDFSKIDTKKIEEKGIETKFEWTEINEEIIKSSSSDFGEISKSSISKYFLEYCKLSDIPKDKIGVGLKILKNDFKIPE